MQENNNVTLLYALAGVWIALQEAITVTFGRSVEPAANRILKEMLPQMQPDAADLCRDLIEFTSSKAAPDGDQFMMLSDSMH